MTEEEQDRPRVEYWSSGEPVSGGRYREEMDRLRDPPQEITLSRKTMFTLGMWAAAGAVTFLVVILPLIVIGAIILFGALGVSVP